jgi:hypothetical protein
LLRIGAWQAEDDKSFTSRVWTAYDERYAIHEVPITEFSIIDNPVWKNKEDG